MEKQVEEEGRLFWMSVLFLGIIIGVPFLINFSAQFFLTLFGALGHKWYVENLWLEGITSYVPFYAIMLFYLKTTFNPLSHYGYTWKKDYMWWAVYLGIGSGIIIYLVDRFVHLPGAGNTIAIQQFGFVTLLGYMASWVLLPAFAEETLFRGVIQRFYGQKTKKTFTAWNISIAVLIASGFEVFFHLVVPVYFSIGSIGPLQAIINTLPQLVYVFVFGFIGGALYQRTGSLTCPIIIHALGNFTELILIWMLR